MAAKERHERQTEKYRQLIGITEEGVTNLVLGVICVMLDGCGV
jgi:hypothetical protein